MTAATPHPTSCLLITAFAGHGKSALLAARCPPGGVVSPASALLASGVPDGVTWVGIDDAHEVSVVDLLRLLKDLARRGCVVVALASRTALPLEVRSALPGPVSERDASDLLFTPYAVSRCVAAASGVTDPETALRVAELTAGWPSLVDFAADALARDPHIDLTRSLTAPNTPAADWMRRAVLDTLPPDAVRTLALLAAIDPTAPFTQALYDAVAHGAGYLPVPEIVEQLRRGGVLAARRRMGASTELVLVPALATILRATVQWATVPSANPRVAGTEGSRGVAAIAAIAATSHEAAGAWLPASRAHAVAGDLDRVRALLVAHSEDMLRAGGAVAVADLVDLVADAASRPRLRRAGSPRTSLSRPRP